MRLKFFVLIFFMTFYFFLNSLNAYLCEDILKINFSVNSNKDADFVDYLKRCFLELRGIYYKIDERTENIFGRREKKPQAKEAEKGKNISTLLELLSKDSTLADVFKNNYHFIISFLIEHTVHPQEVIWLIEQFDPKEARPNFNFKLENFSKSDNLIMESENKKLTLQDFYDRFCNLTKNDIFKINLEEKLNSLMLIYGMSLIQWGKKYNNDFSDLPQIFIQFNANEELYNLLLLEIIKITAVIYESLKIHGKESMEIIKNNTSFSVTKSRRQKGLDFSSFLTYPPNKFKPGINILSTENLPITAINDVTGSVRYGNVGSVNIQDILKLISDTPQYLSDALDTYIRAVFVPIESQILARSLDGNANEFKERNIFLFLGPGKNPLELLGFIPDLFEQSLKEKNKENLPKIYLVDIDPEFKKSIIKSIKTILNETKKYTEANENNEKSKEIDFFLENFIFWETDMLSKDFFNKFNEISSKINTVIIRNVITRFKPEDQESFLKKIAHALPLGSNIFFSEPLWGNLPLNTEVSVREKLYKILLKYLYDNKDHLVTEEKQNLISNLYNQYFNGKISEINNYNLSSLGLDYYLRTPKAWIDFWNQLGFISFGSTNMTFIQFVDPIHPASGVNMDLRFADHIDMSVTKMED